MSAPATFLRTVMFLTVVAAINCFALADDWPRFRGPNGTGVSASRGLPLEFGPTKNVLWKIDGRKGTSSPIIVGSQVFWTSFDGEQRTLHSVDAATGKPQWERAIKKIRAEITTPPNGPATPTPVADGDRIFVLYPDAGLLCYSTAGQELWRKDLGPFHTMHGIGSSLVTTDKHVIVVADQLDGSYVAAFEKETGKPAWKSPRLNGITGGYSTPTRYRPSTGPEQLLLAGPFEVVSYDAVTGKRIWWLNGATNAPITLPLVWKNRVIVCEPVAEPIPFSIVSNYDKNKDGKVTLAEIKSSAAMSRLLERIDRETGNRDAAVDAAEWNKAFGERTNKGGLTAIELGGSEDVTKTHRPWTYRKSVPYIPSPLIYDDLIYVVQDGGILSTFDPQTGNLVKRARLKPGARKYYPSPVAADGKIYLLDSTGGLAVVEAGREWKQLAENELGESCSATPAIADGRLYVRTAKTLYCFGGDSKR